MRFPFTFAGDVRRVVWFDRALFHNRKKLLLAVVGAAFVPALYVTIYLSGAWDPYHHLDRLPVAVAALDEGTEARGQRVNVGARVKEKLDAQKTFAFYDAKDESAVRADVEAGRAVFGVVIPADFSARAIPATKSAPAQVRVILSEGNNFMAATIAKRFADQLAAGTNVTLNEQRWSVVLDSVDHSRGSVAQLRDGVAKLAAGSVRLDDGLASADDGARKLSAGLGAAHDGASTLKTGASQLSDGVSQLSDGVVRLGGGLRQLDTALPTSVTLAPLKQGAADVAKGNKSLSEGLVRIQDGQAKARDGAGKLAEETSKIPVVGKKVSDGAGQIRDGLSQLHTGTAAAITGANQLRDGSAKLEAGVDALADGVVRAHDGVHEMATKLPPDDKLVQLANGGVALRDGAAQLHEGLGELNAGGVRLSGGLAQLHDGSTQLKEGLALLQAALPQNVDGLDGDAGGLASSVQAEVVSLTTVGAYGNAMAPQFFALSLWIGVVMSGFIFQMRWFPERLRRRRKLALVLGRMAVPGALVLGQATLLVFAMRVVVGVHMPSVLALWAVACVTSLTFLSIFVALIAVLGDVGKAVALLLLVFMLSASGAVFPIELAGGVFRAASQFMPFTWVVRAVRITLFDAFGGGYGRALLSVAAFALVALALATVAGRFKFVPRHEMRPLLDV